MMMKYEIIPMNANLTLKNWWYLFPPLWILHYIVSAALCYWL